MTDTPTTYGYSLDEETYYGGSFLTRHEAAEEAVREYRAENHPAPGTTITIFTCEAQYPKEYALSMIDHGYERAVIDPEVLEESLFEEFGGHEDPIIHLDPDQHRELATLIVDFLADHGCFEKFYSADKIASHRFVVE